MNDNAKALVAALRSGDYTQGRGYLTRIDSDGLEQDCCLGVACKLAVEAGVIEPGVVDPRNGARRYRDGGQWQTAVLPERVREWLGFSSKESEFCRSSGYSEQLSALNDDGMSFERIAAIIESEPEGLFAD